MTRWLFALSLFASAIAAACAAVPLAVPFQGRLADAAGRPVPDGSYNVRFTVYNAPAGPQTVTGEYQTFSGDTVTLNHHPVVVNSETIRKSDNTVTYTRGVAYTVDYANGIVTRAGAAAIPDGTVVKIDYQWMGRVLSDGTQTVQTRNGLFATTIAIASASALSGDDWVEVSVLNGSTWEPLSPRVKMASAPYALQVAMLDGADGGSVHGSVSVDGSVTAERTVSGRGASYKVFNRPFTEPGVAGYGVTGTGGEAPGVLAVGANDGAGLGLTVQGRAYVTNSLLVENGAQILPSLSTGSIGANGVVTANGVVVGGSLGAGEGIHTALGLYAGSINTAGDIVSGHYFLGGGLTVPSATISKDLTVGSIAGQAADFSQTLGATSINAGTIEVRGTVFGNVGVFLSTLNAPLVWGPEAQFDTVRTTNLIGGTVAGTGMTKPDYTALGSVWPAAGHYTQFFTLPSALRYDGGNLLIDVMPYEDSSGTRTYWSPRYLDWNTTVNGDVAVSLAPGYSGAAINFRLRVWKTR
jgi:hypothetical protein